MYKFPDRPIIFFTSGYREISWLFEVEARKEECLEVTFI